MPDEEKPRETSVLDLAKLAVTTTRQGDYGPPEDSFDAIAEMWTGYLGLTHNFSHALTKADIAHMMILLKLARIIKGIPTRDSYIDIAGYAQCAHWCSTPQDGNQKP